MNKDTTGGSRATQIRTFKTNGTVADDRDGAAAAPLRRHRDSSYDRKADKERITGYFYNPVLNCFQDIPPHYAPQPHVPCASALMAGDLDEAVFKTCTVLVAMCIVNKTKT